MNLFTRNNGKSQEKVQQQMNENKEMTGFSNLQLMREKSFSLAPTGLTKFKKLDQLVSSREKSCGLRASKQYSSRDIYPYAKNCVLKKEINLKSHLVQSVNTGKQAQQQISGKKIQISIRKDSQYHNTNLGKNNSSRSINSTLRKKKLTVLSSKHQPHNVSSFEQNCNDPNEINSNKQNIQINQLVFSEFDPSVSHEDQLKKLMKQKINQRKVVFVARPLKTTRQIKQLKQSKQKKKIIKLQKKTINAKNQIRVF